MAKTPQPILKLADELVSVVLNDDFSGEFTDRTRGVIWRMSPCCYQEVGPLSECAIWNRRDRCYMDRYPSFFRARKTDVGLRVAVQDQLGETRGELTCAVTLERGVVRFRITAIDESLPSLIFPPYLESDSLVVPRIMGEWWRKPVPESLFLMPASGWAMRWFGGLRGDAGWVAIVEDGYADAGVYLAQHTACAAWQKSMGRWTTPRSVQFRFTGNGYVGQAKAFRAFAKEAGLFCTLREKAEEIPAVRSLIGGRCISFFLAHKIHADHPRLWMRSPDPKAHAEDGQLKVLIPFRDVATVIAEAKQAGMKRGYFNLRGWLQGGYDETHPDTWPHEPGLGTWEELQRIMGERDPFVAMLHDNYQDIYLRSPSFPQYVQRTNDGHLKVGGTWHGGRCYIVNSVKALEYVQRNWETFGKLHPRGAFLDCIGGAHFQEDYAPEHRMTRVEDAAGKLAQVRYHRKRGLLVGTEWASDFCVNEVAFGETRQNRVPFHSIPLWSLVYHDAAVKLRYRTGTDDYEPADDLADLLWGCAKLWPCGDLANWRKQLPLFKQSLVVDEWHAKIGWDEMTNHRYLDAAGLVEQTEFSSGHSIIVNFGAEPYDHAGQPIAPGGYRMLDS